MNKQKKPTKEEPHHSIMEIAGEKAIAIKDGIMEGKDKLVAVASEKFESVKKAIHDFTASSPKPKAAAKKIKKVVKQAEKKTIKKIKTEKKTAKRGYQKDGKENRQKSGEEIMILLLQITKSSLQGLITS